MPNKGAYPLAKRQIILTYIVAGIFFLGGALALLSGIYHASFGLYSLAWPATEGIVAFSKIEVRSGGPDSNDSLCLIVKYQYDVGARSLFGNRLRFGSYCYDDSAEAETRQSFYQPGRTVKVYYDRLDPSRSVLEPGISWAFLTPFLLGIPFTFAGLWGIIHMRRTRREDGRLDNNQSERRKGCEE